MPNLHASHIAAHRIAKLALSSLLIFSVTVPPLAAEELEIPSPPEGAWVDASVALLAYNRERCDRLANRILAFWRSLPAEEGALVAENQKRVRERILKDWLAELTEARTASDIVTEFMPRALEAVDAESAVVLDRLHQLQSQLCDQVAYPAGPMTEFVDRVTDALLQIDTEARNLEHLIVVNPTSLERAIAPYLETLQLAGVEAEGEMLHFLESPETPQQTLTFEALLAVWYERYRKAATASRLSLGQFISARRAGDSRALSEACRALARDAAGMLDHPEVFRGPHDELERPLRRAYIHLQGMAAACVQGNFTRSDVMLKRAEHHLAVVAAHLAPYGYSP